MTNASPDPVPSNAYTQYVAMLPGGKWLVPHSYDGPHYLVPVRHEPAVNLWSSCVLSVFPGRRIPVQAESGVPLKWAAIHALPELARDLLVWNKDDDHPEVDHTTISDPFDQVPSDIDVVRALPALWVQIGPQFPTWDAFDRRHQEIAEQLAQHDPTLLLMVLAKVPDDVLVDVDTLLALLEGILTTA